MSPTPDEQNETPSLRLVAAFLILTSLALIGWAILWSVLSFLGGS